MGSGLPPPRPQLTACDPLLPACWDSSEGGYRVTGGVRTQASVPHDCIQVLRAHTTAPGEGEAARPFRAPELLHPPWPAPTLTPVPAGAGRRQALICHQRDTPSLRGASPTHRDWRGGGSPLCCLRAPNLPLSLRRNWSSPRGPLVTPPIRSQSNLSASGLSRPVTRGTTAPTQPLLGEPLPEVAHSLLPAGSPRPVAKRLGPWKNPASIRWVFDGRLLSAGD